MTSDYATAVAVYLIAHTPGTSGEFEQRTRRLSATGSLTLSCTLQIPTRSPEKQSRLALQLEMM